MQVTKLELLGIFTKALLHKLIETSCRDFASYLSIIYFSKYLHYSYLFCEELSFFVGSSGDPPEVVNQYLSGFFQRASLEYLTPVP